MHEIRANRLLATTCLVVSVVAIILAPPEVKAFAVVGIAISIYSLHINRPNRKARK